MAGLLMRAGMFARLWFSLSLMLLVLLNRSAPAGLAILLLMLYLHLCMDHGNQRLRRTFALLPWFVLPILLLHALFTPGEWIFAGLPVSLEGAGQGAWFALHFTNIFLAALLLAVMLKPQEWLALIGKLPFPYLSNHLHMLILLRRRTGQLLQLLRGQWHGRRQLRSLPALLIAAVRHCLSESRAVAQALWLRWPQSGFPARSTVTDATDRGAGGSDIMLWIAGLLLVLMVLGARFG